MGRGFDRLLLPPSWILSRTPRLFMFHSVGEEGAALCTGEDAPQLPEEAFREFLSWLVDNATIVQARELARLIGARRFYRDRFAALTFDDGFEDNFTVALPILKEFGVTATVYVTAGMIRSDPAAAGEGLTEEQIREMHAFGIEIGAHSLTHPHLDQIPIDAATHEIRRSREIVADLVSAPCEGFCYPYGGVNAAVADAVRSCGFDYAVTTEDRFPNSRDLFNLYRTVLPAETGRTEFAIRLCGANRWRQTGHLVKQELVRRSGEWRSRRAAPPVGAVRRAADVSAQ
jgi:peptidoglycan/xylan/chitin deacetylase (PgdA/CDA1 family)